MTSDALDEDHRALHAAAADGAALCTVVEIDGSFSRRVGAQLAILPGGAVVGSLADGCLERQLAADCETLGRPELRRYGSGSPMIDFRLPCGSGLGILIDPAPDRAACAAALQALAQRQPASLPLPLPIPTSHGRLSRSYVPRLRIAALGEGPELAALGTLARAAGIECRALDKADLALGRPTGQLAVDEWTAVVLLFHDHEWEGALLDEALAGRSFYVGAQGGALARAARTETLRARGIPDAALARIRSPIGTPPGSRTPQTLALAVLAEIAHEYERLRPAF